MKIFHRAADLQYYLKARRTNNRTVGFVPTMGALHQGHLSLVELSRTENQLTVVSIFVNPTQFNDPEDLQKYPRTPGKDVELLAEVGCEVVFLPTVPEVYPASSSQTSPPLDFGSLDKGMEGSMRPGHFQGVAQVVERLLNLTQPDKLYLGQKDYQQVAIIRSMVKQRNIAVTIRMSPTVRASDGLALSSRNARLTSPSRKQAPKIYQILIKCRDSVLEGQTPSLVAEQGLRQLSVIPGLQPEYLEIVDGDTLLPLANLQDAERAVICTAVWAGNIRLIDNVVIK